MKNKDAVRLAQLSVKARKKKGTLSSHAKHMVTMREMKKHIGAETIIRHAYKPAQNESNGEHCEECGVGIAMQYHHYWKCEKCGTVGNGIKHHDHD